MHIFSQYDWVILLIASVQLCHSDILSQRPLRKADHSIYKIHAPPRKSRPGLTINSTTNSCFSTATAQTSRFRTCWNQPLLLVRYPILELREVSALADRQGLEPHPGPKHHVGILKILIAPLSFYSIVNIKRRIRLRNNGSPLAAPIVDSCRR